MEAKPERHRIWGESSQRAKICFSVSYIVIIIVIVQHVEHILHIIIVHFASVAIGIVYRFGSQSRSRIWCVQLLLILTSIAFLRFLANGFAKHLLTDGQRFFGRTLPLRFHSVLLWSSVVLFMLYVLRTLHIADFNFFLKFNDTDGKCAQIQIHFQYLPPFCIPSNSCWLLQLK